MKLFYIYFKNEEDELKLVKIVAEDKKQAQIIFIKHRNLELENINKISEISNEIENINGVKYKIEYKEVKEPKKVEFGGVEFGEVGEIVRKGF